MILTLRFTLLLSLAAALLSGCAGAPTNEAPQGAVLSTAPGAPGYMVVGLAEENAGSGVTHAALALALAFRRDDGATAVMSRKGCGSMAGFYGSKPCDLTRLDWQVIQVQPGLWRPASVAEVTKIILGSKRVRATLPGTTPVKVGPGEVVYIGDFTLAADYDAPEFVVRRHGRDDAAARRALAAYPGLREAPVVYRDPTEAATAR